MRKLGLFSLFILIAVLLIGCSSSDDNSVSTTEKDLVSKELEEELGYIGEYTITNIKNAGSGLGSPLNRTLTITLDELNNVEIEVFYSLSSFGRVVEDTDPSIYIDSFVDNYLLSDMLGLSTDEAVLRILPDWNDGGYAEYDDFTNLEKLDILLGKSDLTLEEYITKLGALDTIEVYIETGKSVLNNQRILDFFDTIRSIGANSYTIHAKDADIIYDISSKKDNPDIPLFHIGYANKHYNSEKSSDLDYTIQANFPNSAELGSFMPDLYSEHGLKYSKLRLNDTGEEFTIWGLKNTLYGEDGEFLKYTGLGSSSNLYLHRLNNVLQNILASKTNLTHLGEVVIFDEDGYPFRRIEGLTEQEIRTQLSSISYIYNDGLRYGILLNNSVFETDLHEVGKYIAEVGKLLPNIAGGVYLLYAPEDSLKHDLKYHTEMTLSIHKEIGRELELGYSSEDIARYKSIEVLDVPRGFVLDDNYNLISSDELGRVLYERLAEYTKNLEREK